MGGDDSQKLLPWRGIHSSPGRKPPAQLRINNVTETAGWNLAGAPPPPSLAGLAVASATGGLGHFWKAHPGQFWRAPKNGMAQWFPVRLHIRTNEVGPCEFDRIILFCWRHGWPRRAIC